MDLGILIGFVAPVLFTTIVVRIACMAHYCAPRAQEIKR